ncbi:MAG: response regulator [Chloroflexi bacterium]|nr:response regulator [Chloroflexota bacterium]
MTESSIHILLVEDEQAHAELVRRAFDRHTGRFCLTVADTLEQARAYLAESVPNLVITDLLLPDGRGTDLLPAESKECQFPLVVMTSHGDEQVAVEAMKAGALDYIVKSVDTLADMPRIAERALREWGYIVDRKRAEEEATHSQRLLLALSQAAQAVQRARTPETVYSAIGEQVAKLGLDATVLTLSEDQTHLILAHLTLKSDLVWAAEKLTGLSAQGYRFPLTLGSFFQRIITGRKTTFDYVDAACIAEALPRPVRPLADRLVDLLGWQQGIIAPLTIDGEVYGLLVVIGIGLTESDVPAITAFANQAAIAIENARLYKETQQLAAFNESIIQSMTEGIIIDDTDGVLTFVNPAAAEMLGYTPNELVGLHGTVIVPPDQRSIVQAADERRMRGEADRYELELMRKDGQRIFVLVSGTPRFDTEGHFTGTMPVLTNITERKHVEDALQESEARYRNIFQTAGVSIWEEDFSETKAAIDDLKIQGVRDFRQYLNDHPEFVAQAAQMIRVRDVNQTTIKILGARNKEELLGSLDKVFVPETLQILGEELVAIAEGQTYFEGETINQTLQGERRNVMLTMAIPAQAEKFESVLVSMMDITERKRTEEALRENEKLLRKMAENYPNSYISIIEKNYTVSFASGQEFNKQNIDPEQFVGLTIEQVFGDQAAIVRQHYEKTFEGKERSFELFINNQYRLYRTVPLLSDDGSISRILVLAENITERVRAEAEREQLLMQVQNQARMMQGIMNTVPEGVLLLEANGCIAMANPASGQALAVLVGRDDISTHKPLTRLGDHLLAELLISLPKGRWHEVKANDRIFEIIGRPMEPTADGRSEKWVLVIRDVTQDREIKQRIQQQEKMAAVGQLAAGVAHDFNNIMATVILYTQMSLKAPDLSPKIRQRLETVVGQAYRATDLVQQILDFSRRAVLERRPMDMTPFLKEVVALLERTVPENVKMDLSYSIDEYTVNADPTRMQQAIMNLVVNARDAMPEGGELHIALSRTVETDAIKCVTCDQIAKEEWVRIAVTDTGEGIPSDVLLHIFDPFFTTKDVGKGTGLGLAQVYGIVKQHEGHIDVSTEVGVGTTFMLYLPVLLASSPKATDLKTEALVVQGQGETILMVEDNVALRQALVGTLEQLNYQVLEAANGREALDMLEVRAGEISLVLSDLVMPEMGGRALFHTMQQRGLTLPVVMLSGHPMENELEDLQSQGLAGWMLKPPDMERLSRMLVRVLKDCGDADVQ